MKLYKQFLIFAYLFFFNNSYSMWGWLRSSQSPQNASSQTTTQPAGQENLKLNNFSDGTLSTQNNQVTNVKISREDYQEFLRYQEIKKNNSVTTINLIVNANPIAANSSDTSSSALNSNSNSNSNSSNPFLGVNNQPQNNNSAQSVNQTKVQVSQQVLNQLTFYGENTKNFITQNKYKFIFGSIILSYSYLSYKIFTLKKLLKSDSCISNCFYKNQNLSDILKIPTSELAQNLVNLVCGKYVGPEAFENNSLPMTKFLADIKREKKILKNYYNICYYIKLLKISKLFYIDYEIFDNYKERLAKLNYMQKLFEDFMAASFRRKINP